MVAYRVIGKSVPRAEGADKVTGSALYTADLAPEGVLWGKTLHSPYAHARIVSIDTSAAKRLPGVHAVLTSEDLPSTFYGRAIKDAAVLARDVVRYAGERIAAVAADDEDIAQQALNLIEVEYEELPAVFDFEDAMAADAPQLHPEFESYPGATPRPVASNVYARRSFERGDVEAGFAAADMVIENTYYTQRVHQAYLEPQSVLVQVDGDRVNAWSCSKAPYNVRESLATAAGVPEDHVTLHPALIGGDFGGKGLPQELAVAYFLARSTGRPVRMVMDYIEEFMAGNPRHRTMVRLRTGVKRDGTLTAHQVQMYVNCGAYAAYKPLGVIGGANQAAGPYRYGAVKVESAQVYTNTIPGGHMRSPGEPQALFAIESHMDEIARALGVDPIEFRIKTLVREGEETAMGDTAHSPEGGIQSLQGAARAAKYDSPKGRHVGRGIALGDRGPGGGQGSAEITLRPDGSILLSTPIFDQGTGTYTTLRQVVAEELQTAPERIEISVWSTDAVSFDSGIGGARGTRLATRTAYEAAQSAKQELFDLATEQLGWPREALVMRDDEVRRTDTEDAVAWRDLVASANRPVTGRSEVDDRRPAGVTSYTAQLAEVEVDTETGEVTLLNFTTAHDVGQIINPVGHQGQINGGFLQGLGYALMEELRVEDGHVTTLSFGDFKIPTTMDLPPLQTVLIETDHGVGPYQVKGIGENSNSPVAAAIANAIEDAVGVRIRDLPITPEKVYRALQALGDTGA